MATERPPSPGMAFELGARSETGFVREVNEDRMGWVRTRFGDVIVTCDGMGGHSGGALAAEITVRSLQDELSHIPPQSDHFTDQVRQAFQTANRAVHERRQPDDPDTRDMGATAVALVTSGQRFIVAHVGDSRAYLWRGGQLRQLTRDHTAVQEMMDKGLISPEQAAGHPDASVLSRAMGHQPSVQVDVMDWQPLVAGDLLLLCSDGLSGFVSNEAIAAVLAEGGAAQDLADRLVRRALDTGGHDNVTVQLVRYVPGGGGLARAALRPGILAAVAITAAVAAVIAWLLTADYRHEIATLKGLKAPQAAASAASAASTASAASALPPAASRPASAPPTRPLPAPAQPPSSPSQALPTLPMHPDRTPAASAPADKLPDIPRSLAAQAARKKSTKAVTPTPAASAASAASAPHAAASPPTGTSAPPESGDAPGHPNATTFP